MLSKAINDVIQGLSLWKIWTYQAWHDMTARYKRTALGSLWLAGQMVTLAICMSLVWGALQGVNLHDMLPYITAGLLCYGMVGFIMNQGVEVFMSAAGVIRNNAFPFSFYVLEDIARLTFTFLHNAVIFFIVEACVGAFVIPNWTILIGLPIVMASIFVWGSVAGMLAARFRDLRYLIPHAGQLVFYLTPIIWRMSDMPSGHTFKRSLLADLNPFYGLLELLRSPLLGQTPPAVCWTLSLVFLGVGIVVWLIAFTFFRRRIPFWI